MFDINDYNPWGDSETPYDLWERTADSLEKQADVISQMKSDSDKESKINSRRFVIQTVLSVFSLVASVIAAVAAIIALL